MTPFVLVGMIAVASLAFHHPSEYAHATATAQSDRPSAATGEITVLVRQALEDRLAARNVPDLNLLGSATKIAIREGMPSAGMRLDDKALPQLQGYEFYLISEAAAQATADKTGKSVPFLTVDRPSISTDSATIRMGVDLVFPREPKLIKLCCCTGTGAFRLVNGRWTFVSWSQMICS